MIGYKAALYARELLELEFSEDEDVVCITENDACGVDAIQVLLGCSVGKGNLLFHIRGKKVFSIYNRKNGTSVRLVLRLRPENIPKEDSFTWYRAQKSERYNSRVGGFVPDLWETNCRENGRIFHATVKMAFL